MKIRQSRLDEAISPFIATPSVQAKKISFNQIAVLFSMSRTIVSSLIELSYHYLNKAISNVKKDTRKTVLSLRVTAECQVSKTSTNSQARFLSKITIPFLCP